MAKGKRMPKQELTAWQRAAEFGVDMSLLETSLRRTPTQRIEAHECALSLAEELRNAGEAVRAQRERTDPETR
jgi:hypothetical protein